MTQLYKNQYISKILGITEPFLMIDQFDLIKKGKSGIAIKKLSNSDWFFSCHLPKYQVMPATLLTEGMLQTMVLLIYLSYEHNDEPALVTDIKVKQFSSAKPNQEIVFDAQLKSFRRGISKGEVACTADGKLLCRGEFSYASPHLMLIPTK